MPEYINWFNINVTLIGLVSTLVLVYYWMYLSHNKKRDPANLERNALLNIRDKFVCKSMLSIKRECIAPMLILKYMPDRSVSKVYAWQQSPLNPNYSLSIWYVPCFAVVKYESFQELRHEYDEFCKYFRTVIPMINSALNAGSDSVTLKGRKYSIVSIRDLTASHYKRSVYPLNLFKLITDIAYNAFCFDYARATLIDSTELSEHACMRKSDEYPKAS